MTDSKVCVADIVTLQRLADTMRKDMNNGFNGLSAEAVRSIAGIIDRAIGAPIDMPTRSMGCAGADETYPGSPDLRLAFNWGVRWTLEHAYSTQPISNRFPAEEVK